MARSTFADWVFNIFRLDESVRFTKVDPVGPCLRLSQVLPASAGLGDRAVRAGDRLVQGTTFAKPINPGKNDPPVAAC